MAFLPFRSLVDQAAGFAGSHRVRDNRRLHLITTVTNSALLWTAILYHAHNFVHHAAPLALLALAGVYAIAIALSGRRHLGRFALAAIATLLLSVSTGLTLWRLAPGGWWRVAWFLVSGGFEHFGHALTGDVHSVNRPSPTVLGKTLKSLYVLLWAPFFFVLFLFDDVGYADEGFTRDLEAALARRVARGEVRVKVRYEDSQWSDPSQVPPVAGRSLAARFDPGSGRATLLMGALYVLGQAGMARAVRDLGKGELFRHQIELSGCSATKRTSGARNSGPRTATNSDLVRFRGCTARF